MLPSVMVAIKRFMFQPTSSAPNDFVAISQLFSYAQCSGYGGIYRLFMDENVQFGERIRRTSRAV
jgi:hypothetical protein